MLPSPCKLSVNTLYRLSVAAGDLIIHLAIIISGFSVVNTWTVMCFPCHSSPTCGRLVTFFQRNRGDSSLVMRRIWYGDIYLASRRHLRLSRCASRWKDIMLLQPKAIVGGTMYLRMLRSSLSRVFLLSIIDPHCLCNKDPTDKKRNHHTIHPEPSESVPPRLDMGL